MLRDPARHCRSIQLGNPDSRPTTARPLGKKTVIRHPAFYAVCSILLHIEQPEVPAGSFFCFRCWLARCLQPGLEILINTMKNKVVLSFIALAMLLGTAKGQDSYQADHKPVKNFQLSILPLIGSDGAETANNAYRLSVNIFAGITGGVDGLEAGGFLNISRGDVRGVQVSGFGNVVSGDIRGFQGAGFINMAGGDVYAFRSAGFLNITGGNGRGLEWAGFANVTGGSYQGVSGAGFANVTGGNYNGVSGAGFANVTGGNYQGLAGAGFANVTGGNHQGLAGAGFANITKGDFQGFQAAGFGNFTTGNVRGLQAAGFINIAREVDGVQLGFINIADTISGVPIGFLSIVKKGRLRQFEISGSDVLHAGAAFRIGVPAFYNIFSIGFRPFDAGRTGGFGYGVGTAIGIADGFSLNIEAHTTQLRKNWRWEIREADWLNEGRLLLAFNTGSRIQLFAGAVLYGHFYRDCPDCQFSPSDIAPTRVFYERNHGNYTTKYWFGGRAGLRMAI
jgi:hypothetical protein